MTDQQLLKSIREIVKSEVTNEVRTVVRAEIQTEVRASEQRLQISIRNQILESEQRMTNLIQSKVQKLFLDIGDYFSEQIFPRLERIERKLDLFDVRLKRVEAVTGFVHDGQD